MLKHEQCERHGSHICCISYAPPEHLKATFTRWHTKDKTSARFPSQPLKCFLIVCLLRSSVTRTPLPVVVIFCHKHFDQAVSQAKSDLGTGVSKAGQKLLREECTKCIMVPLRMPKQSAEGMLGIVCTLVMI